MDNREARIMELYRRMHDKNKNTMLMTAQLLCLAQNNVAEFEEAEKEKEIKKRMGKNIRRFRTERKISMNRTAQALNISPVTLRRVESGKYMERLNISILIRAAFFFDKLPEEFFEPPQE